MLQVIKQCGHMAKTGDFSESQNTIRPEGRKIPLGAQVQTEDPHSSCPLGLLSDSGLAHPQVHVHAL